MGLLPQRLTTHSRSGDGFKFGVLIGEFAADVALGVKPMVDGMLPRMDPANVPRYPCKQTYRGVPGGEAEVSLQLGGGYAGK